jgi:hypothetical protein
MDKLLIYKYNKISFFMIKKYLDFISESNYMSSPPGPGEENVIAISISDSDLNLFESEPILSKLISDQQISVIGNQLYYYDEDRTISILNQFFPEKIVNTLNGPDLEKGHVDNK